ncbi:hypothetical protein Hte_001518 [Hypoxylon texense]
MRLSSLILVATSSVAFAQTRSSKRGLVYVPNDDSPGDDQIWVQSGSDLTWYYNYESTPSSAFSGVPQDRFEFVPMLWGPVDGTTFLDSVQSQMDAGLNITHVLGFNEPDSPYNGGSNIQPSEAADIWVKNIAPLADRGVQLGLPACTGGPDGLPWLRQFLANCSQLISTADETRNCTYDFVTLHWYGNFEGLASHMGEYAAEFINVTQWITEYNYDNQDLTTTQSFFNTSAEYFDRLEFVGRYSMFGSFRSKDSNVGPNAAMLNNDGQLTDIGAWYLGISGTGVDPQSGEGRRLTPAVSAIAFSLVIGALVIL